MILEKESRGPTSQNMGWTTLISYDSFQYWISPAIKLAFIAKIAHTQNFAG